MKAEQTSTGYTVLELAPGEAKSLLALIRLSLDGLSKMRESGYALRKERSLTGAASKLAFELQEQLEIATGERLRRVGSRRRVAKPHGLE